MGFIAKFILFFFYFHFNEYSLANKNRVIPTRKPNSPQMPSCTEKNNCNSEQHSDSETGNKTEFDLRFKESQIQGSPEYHLFLDSCKDLKRKTWKNKNINPNPNDTCSLNTFAIAAMVFDVDFPFFNCLINNESGAKKLTREKLQVMYLGEMEELGLIATYHIQPSASMGSGNGYGCSVSHTWTGLISPTGTT